MYSEVDGTDLTASSPRILITGGAGFIGSTIASYCLDHGITPIIVDDFSVGLPQFTQGRIAYQGDIADRDLVRRIIAEHGPIWGVIHCAAKTVVPESVAHPVEYYETNIAKSIVLLRTLIECGVRRVVFSSTAALYADNADLCVNESSAVSPASPYAASKYMYERVLADAAAAGEVEAVALRYFNPIGADPLMRTGLQNPYPTHALGKMIQAYRENKVFQVTGTDWPTRDGSGVRDYIHVWDIARAHVAVLAHFDRVMAQSQARGFDVINLGTGRGSTVLELLNEFREAMGVELPVEYAPRRLGDVAGTVTSTDKARDLLGWQAELSVVQGIRDAVSWSERLPRILAGS
ncbi:UDP-glucose 4-epimerase GalE [Trueperella sp. LYQ141]|uniref:UDP-glucose 4-epimerase GalE n=1 Tax=Trueperella sp. LYQ141 TaxID=3391058 RepID=UPI0039834707